MVLWHCSPTLAANLQIGARLRAPLQLFLDARSTHTLHAPDWVGQPPYVSGHCTGRSRAASPSPKHSTALQLIDSDAVKSSVLCKAHCLLIDCFFGGNRDGIVLGKEPRTAWTAWLSATSRGCFSSLTRFCSSSAHCCYRFRCAFKGFHKRGRSTHFIFFHRGKGKLETLRKKSGWGEKALGFLVWHTGACNKLRDCACGL
jgi:hypothetical protein